MKLNELISLNLGWFRTVTFFLPIILLQMWAHFSKGEMNKEDAAHLTEVLTHNQTVSQSTPTWSLAPEPWEGLTFIEVWVERCQVLQVFDTVAQPSDLEVLVSEGRKVPHLLLSCNIQHLVQLWF